MEGLIMRLQLWKAKIADLEESMKHFESSLKDVSKWNTAKQEYLQDNMEVAKELKVENFQIIKVEIIQQQRKATSMEEKVLDEDFTMNNPVHTPVGKPIILPVPEQGVIPKFINRKMKRNKRKSKWRKNKWKDKQLSNRIPKVYNSGKMFRMMLENFQPWKGSKFKEHFQRTDGNHKGSSMCKTNEEITMSRMIFMNFGPWKGAKFKLKEAFHMHDGMHTQDGLNFGYIKS